MQIQVNSNNSVNMTESMMQWASGEVGQALDRYAGKITRVVVNFNDTNADKGGALDKYCSIEARLGGLEPMATNHKASNFHLALTGALEKLDKVLSRAIDKIDHKKGRMPTGGEPFADLGEPVDNLSPAP